MPPPDRDDPHGSFDFTITIAGVSDDGGAVKASFAEVSGLQVELAAAEHRAGSEDSTVRKGPRLEKFRKITLKRGVIADYALLKWIIRGMSGEDLRADGRVILVDEHGQEVRRWNFRRGWPTGLSGLSIPSNASEIAIETLEIHHEGLSVGSRE